MKRIKLFISGKVQGVFFRSFIKRTAVLLNLTGFVKNLPDGRVEVLFEGPDEKVKEAVELCKRGPERADVKNFEIEEEEYAAEFKDFTII